MREWNVAELKTYFPGERIACPLCGCNRWRSVQTDQPVVEQEYQAVQCMNPWCAHSFLLGTERLILIREVPLRMEPRALARWYLDEQYQSYDYPEGHEVSDWVAKRGMATLRWRAAGGGVPSSATELKVRDG